jgi:aryl-alcohol dehydrogenase-like predicted oxidoreductase
MLARSPVVIPIPGARRPETIRDSAAGAEIALSPADVAAVQLCFGGKL